MYDAKPYNYYRISPIAKDPSISGKICQFIEYVIRDYDIKRAKVVIDNVNEYLIAPYLLIPIR